MNRVTRGKALSVLTALWVGHVALTPVAYAEAAFVGEKWVDTIKFSGDMRVRHESFFNKTAGQKDRDRERFRMRFGIKATMQDILVGVKFASGTGEQVSTNQTFGNMYAQKGLYIDQAYMQWKAREFLTLTGGRMPNPFWRTYASDVMWDGDVNPEGYAVSFARKLSDRLDLFAHVGALPLHENSTIEADPWLFGYQIGGGIKASEDTKLNMGLVYYAASNETLASLAPGNQQEGNSRVGAGPQLATHFRIAQFTGELKSHIGPVPAALQGDFIRNMKDDTNIGSNGYQTGVILGKAKNAGSLEFAYFYKYLQSNASFADLADSDFGNGGTNRKGHIMWLAYAPRDYVTLSFKYFLTRRLNPFLSTTGAALTTPGYSDINRLQCDIVVKF